MTPLPKGANIDTIVYLADMNTRELLPPDVIGWALEEASRVLEVTPADIIGRSRDRKLVTIRHILCYTLRYKYRLSLAEIGKRLKRDHTTGIHSCQRAHSYLLSGDEYFMHMFNLLKQQTDLLNRLEIPQKKVFTQQEERKEISRPKPIYSNRSPFGIAE